jgi:hypothetical protein
MRQLDELTEEQAAAAVGIESQPLTERAKTVLKKYSALLISLVLALTLA